jgi:hypothetical protein
MSLLLAAGVAAAYAGGVVGLHRYAVHRRRASAQRYSTLAWLDWDTLLAGLLPAPLTMEATGPSPKEGGPVPRVLRRPPSDPEMDLLSALVSGGLVTPEALRASPFSGGEARWLALLAGFREDPLMALAELEATPPGSVAEAYFREWLALRHTPTLFNVELVVFGSKRRLNHALIRFGEAPALYFARAGASGLLGLTGAVLDDLARAVYFSREAPFYCLAVAQLPFVEEVRPALARACREALARSGLGAANGVLD